MYSSGNLMWVEKYRPKTLDELVNQKETVQRLKEFLVKTEEMPHMLFAGPPGTGKTTAGLCIAHHLYQDSWREFTLELNASDERGIGVVREKVKTFSQFFDRTMGIPFKLVILDEADMMTSEAQTALRRIMEMSARTTRFFLICNYSSRIIYPIQSRCAIFKFTRMGEEDVSEFLSEICEKEDIRYEEEALREIHRVTEGDLRRAINLLQSVSGLSEVAITAKQVRSIAGDVSLKTIKEILRGGVYRDYPTARKKLFEYMASHGLSGFDVIRLTMRALSEEGMLSSEIAEALAEFDYRLVEGANEDIQISALLAQLIQFMRDKR